MSAVKPFITRPPTHEAFDESDKERLIADVHAAQAQNERCETLHH